MFKTVLRRSSKHYCDGKQTDEIRFYISSFKSNVRRFAGAVRGHRGIENSIHWVSDMTFREDESRIRKDHGPDNFALLRRPCNPRIYGNVSMTVKSFDEGSRATRFFPFAVKDAAQKPAAGAKVQVVDKEGRAVAEGVTDKAGLIELGVAFDADNYKEANFSVVVNGERKQGLSFTDSSTEPLYFGHSLIRKGATEMCHRRIMLFGSVIFLALCSGSPVQATVTGTDPNAAGDTIVDQDTVWRGQKVKIGGDLVVQKGCSFTIDGCDVLFDATCPKGRTLCGPGATIVIKDSYLHGRSEFDRAAGLVLGEENDRLTVKVSGTTFKYLGTWDERPGSAKITYMVLAKAIYSPESFFRGNSLICDEMPGLPGPKPGKNWVWAFVGPLDAANVTPAHGIKVEDCYFFQPNVAVDRNKYLSQSCVRACAEPFHTPPAYFLADGNWFEDGTHKPYNLFGPSHHGLTKDNYFLNTAIDFTTTGVGKPSDNVFVNNIMVSAFSSYLGIRGPRASNGWGDRTVFIGNRIINHDRGLFCTGGKDWVVAGNKITNTGGSYGVGSQAYLGDEKSREKYRLHLDDATHGSLIIGNVLQDCGRDAGGICLGATTVWPSTYWKDAVIAGNEIANCKGRGIWLSNAHRAVIKGNAITGNAVGIEIAADSRYCNILDNKFSENRADLKGSPSKAEEFPQARILSPGTNEFRVGQAVTFKGEGTAKGEKKVVSYWWFFGDGTMSAEQNPLHTFARDGKYFVAFLVTDSAGLRDIAIMPGRIDAVWNQSADPVRPWLHLKPRLAAYPNPLYLSCNSPAAFVPYYYMGKVKVRIEGSGGKLVREIDGLTFEAPRALDWDRKDAGGKQVSPGKYVAVAVDQKGREVGRCKLSILQH